MKSIDSAYVIFAAIYASLVVASNLIFQKFLFISVTEEINFSVSAGLLVFPATFLITDIISEIYGKKLANLVVWSGFIGFLFVTLVVKLAIHLPAEDWSPVKDEDFSKVFGFVDIAYFSSLLSSLIAQFLDIHIFHYIGDKTKGKHLWLRNNVSTFISQFIDSFLVISILVFFNVISMEVSAKLFLNSYMYKFLFALADTPFIYLFVILMRAKVSSARKYQN